MSDFAEGRGEAEIGPSKGSEDNHQPGAGSDDRELFIPTSAHTTSLSYPKEAPLWLRLAYKACIPCRKAVSRCDGHEYYTQACTQCKTRKVECTWALSRHEKSASAKEFEGHSGQEGDVSTLQNQVNCTPSTSASPSAAQVRDALLSSASQRSTSQRDADSLAIIDEEGRGEPHDRTRRRLKKRFRFPQDEVTKKGMLNRQSVPSAGWHAVSTASTRRQDLKGKGKARDDYGLQDGYGSQIGTTETSAAGAAGSNVGNTQEGLDEGSASDYDAILSQLTSTHRGSYFLETSSYHAILRSIFAEDASNLSRCLYWWEASESAKRIRSLWKALPVVDKKEWKKMSSLDKLLAENTYMWPLWPRPPRYETFSSAYKDTIYPPTSLDDNRFISILREAIISTASSFLYQSSVPDNIIAGATEQHIRAWTQLKRDYGIPATIETRKQWRRQTVFGKSRSKYAIPPTSTLDFTAMHLNRDELVLDIMEETGSHIAATVQHELDSVLLNIAAFRDPKGMRRPLKGALDGRSGGERRDTANGSALERGNEDADTQNVMERGAGDGPDATSGERKSKDRGKKKGKGKLAGDDVTSRVDETDTILEQQKGKSEDGKKKSKAPAAPANWEKVLLAAISVPTLSRRVIEASVQRLEAMYGPSQIAFLSRWDAMHAPLEFPRPSNEDFSKLPTPSINKRKRDSYLEDLDARRAAKQKRILQNRQSIPVEPLQPSTSKKDVASLRTDAGPEEK